MGNGRWTQLAMICGLLLAPCIPGHAQGTVGAAPSWSSPSLLSETTVGPNGAVTTRAALLANEKWGIGNTKRVERVTDGVYAMRGWGIGSSFAIEAPDGWIVIETGDFTRAAAEMRSMLEETLGRKVKVAAILLTHWHYANGIGAWLDEGGEVWGHEYLDRNRSASKGISVLGGITPAMAQSAVGQGSAYAFTPHDAQGRYLDGGKTYRVTLPAPVPAKEFWSFVVYSGQHRSLLETDQKSAGVDSLSPDLLANPDGSCTVWFAPTAPAGQEGNWVQTRPGKSWSALLRLYAPLEPWFDKSWKPGDFDLVDEGATA